MVAFRDQIREVNERSTERMSLRTKPRIRAAIQRAAALLGVDESHFTMNAAYTAAIRTIDTHERTMLEPVDHAPFFSLLDRPPEPTAKLRAAFDRQQGTTSSQ